jgi:hypothetical protein
VRKCRGGRTGQEYYFGVREVQLPELDEDGEPVTTLVIQWGAQQQQPVKPVQDLWQEDRKTETRQATRCTAAMTGATCCGADPVKERLTTSNGLLRDWPATVVCS